MKKYGNLAACMVALTLIAAIAVLGFDVSMSNASGTLLYSVAATTAIATTFKSELLEAAHNFLITLALGSTTGTSGQFTLAVTSVAGIAVGMPVSGTNIATGAIVASIDSQTQVTLSKAHTGAVSGTITFTGDAFKLLLIKSASPAGAYDGTLKNVGTPGTGSPSTTNVGTDEASGTGYTTGGLALTNVSPVATNPTTSAAISFSNTIQWTGATLSVVAAVIYNTTVRLGAAANGITANASGSAINRVASVHDFGGTQSVTAGTLTLTVPTQDGTTGLIRLT
jgi:hypothetical protein